MDSRAAEAAAGAGAALASDEIFVANGGERFAVLGPQASRHRGVVNTGTRHPPDAAVTIGRRARRNETAVMSGRQRHENLVVDTTGDETAEVEPLSRERTAVGAIERVERAVHAAIAAAHAGILPAQAPARQPIPILSAR